MSKPNSQLSLGPMALERVASGVATASNKVAAVDLCALLDSAFKVEGHSGQIAGAMLGMSPQSYSKAISPHYVDNPVMKKLGLPDNRQVLLRFLALAGEAVGLAPQDSEQTRVLRDFARVIVKVVNQ